MSEVLKKKIHLTVYSSFNMKIIIAGYGFVGKAVARTLEKKHELVIIDPKYSEETIDKHPDADGIIICVGTPHTDENTCDDSQVYAVLESVPVFMPVLIKSTIVPDQLFAIESAFDKHSICYNPEFLRAVSSVEDFANQKYMVLGGEDPEGFWQELFTSVLPDCKLYFYCNTTEASIVKYSINSFLALKVAFFNQLYDLCEASGADYNLVRQIVTHDTRIGNSHTVVGLDGDRGFGGACFPKDTNALIEYANRAKTPLSILETAVRYNKTIRKNS
jgi:UDPglucose 6-dehydrogenase